MNRTKDIIKKRLAEFLDTWVKTDHAYARLLKRWDITLPMCWILEYLYENPSGLEPAVIAERTNMLRQTTTLTLDMLEKRGIVCREPHPTDRRKKLIKLAPHGTAFAGEIIETMSAVECEAMSQFTDEEQRQLINNSRRFYEAIERAAAEKNPKQDIGLKKNKNLMTSEKT